MDAWTIASRWYCLIPRKCDLQPPGTLARRFQTLHLAKHGRETAISKPNACLTERSLSPPSQFAPHSVDRNALPASCHWAISTRMRFLSSLPTLVLGISVTRAICVGIAHLLICPCSTQGLRCSLSPLASSP